MEIIMSLNPLKRYCEKGSKSRQKRWVRRKRYLHALFIRSERRKNKQRIKMNKFSELTDVKFID